MSQTDSKKNTILIIYTGGAYGTFVDWCIHYFAGEIPDDQLPFQTDGSAHGWKGCATGDVTTISHHTINWWLEQIAEPLVLRTHMLDDMYHMEEFLTRYADRFRRVVVLCHDVSCHLLLLQNMLTKIKCIPKSEFLQKIYDRFRDQFHADKILPRWQQREILSYWHEDWHGFMTDLYQPSDHPSVINISPQFLISNFEQCITELFCDLNIKMCRTSSLSFVRDQWLALQKYKDTDAQCQAVVDAVINNQNISTACCDNDVINESFVLYKLRVEHNLDFLCTGMDVFPADTRTLRKKMVPYVDQH